MADFMEYYGADFSHEFLAHYGVGHDKGGSSGRYKWGSGDRPYQRTSMEGKNYGDSSVAKEIQKRHKKEAKGYQKSLRKLEYKRTVKKNYGKDTEAAEISKKIKETISELESRGYALNSKNFQQYVDHGEQIIGYLLAGPFGALAASAIYSNKHKEDSKKYTVRTPEQAKLDAAKDKEKKLLDEYYDAADKVERSHPDYDKNYDKLYDDMKRKEKAANDAMVERARVQHPDDSDEKIAKRLGFQVDEVKSVPKSGRVSSKDIDAKHDRDYDDAIKKLSNGSDSEKAWAEVLKVERNRNSYKTEEEYDSDRGKALDAYEAATKANNRNGSDQPRKAQTQKTPAQQQYERHQKFVNSQQKNKLTDSQQERYNNAKSKDLWDMTFLEMYQPNGEWNETKALREYKAYLLDPEEWIKDH